MNVLETDTDMKIFLIVLFAAAAGFLWMDNSSKRAALAQSELALEQSQTQLKAQQQEVQRVTQERDRAVQDLARAKAAMATSGGLTSPGTVPAVAATPAEVDWMQKRRDESKSRLDPHASRSPSASPRR